MFIYVNDIERFQTSHLVTYGIISHIEIDCKNDTSYMYFNYKLEDLTNSSNIYLI
jgi:hypothetical protein